MTQTLTAAGLTPEQGHSIARIVERRLREQVSGPGDELTPRELHEFVEDVLRSEVGDDAARRFRRWTILKRKDIPIMLLIGGATGSGKSTAATQLASRLGITRIASTDLIRQVMRAFFSPALMPVLHHSSFDIPIGGMAIPGHESDDLGLLGFIEQARSVCVGANAILERAERERVSTLIEGVHLVPGLMQPIDTTRTAVVEVVLYVESEDMHRSHFTMRAMQTDGSRAVEPYLRSFERIRQIQEYLVERAEIRGVPVVENTYVDETVRRLVDHTLDVVERVAREREETRPPERVE